jgi:hypothetical protein
MKDWIDEMDVVAWRLIHERERADFRRCWRRRDIFPRSRWPAASD